MGDEKGRGVGRTYADADRAVVFMNCGDWESRGLHSQRYSTTVTASGVGLQIHSLITGCWQSALEGRRDVCRLEALPV